MPSTPGTIEIIAREIGRALEPLEEILGPDIVERLGLTLPNALTQSQGVTAAFGPAAGIVKALPPIIQSLATAIENEDGAGIISSGKNLLEKVIQLINALGNLGNAIKNASGGLGFSPAEINEINKFGEELAIKILHYMAVGYMDKNLPTLASTLNVLGIVENDLIEENPAKPLQAEFQKREIHFGHIIDLFTDPGEYLSDLYRFGANDFDGTLLLTRIKTMLERFGFPADLYKVGSQPPVLEAYYFSLQADKSTNPPSLKLELRIPAAFEANQTIDLVGPWKATLQSKGTFQAGIEGRFTPPFSAELEPPSGELSFEVLLGLKAEHPGDRRVMFIGTTGGSRLESKSIGGSMGFNARWNSVTGKAEAEPAVEIRIEQGKLVIDLSQGDGFLQQVLSGFGLEADFDLTGTWAPSTGLQLIGSGAIELLLPIHINLGIAEIKGVYIIVGFGTDAPLHTDLAVQMAANLGPLKAVVDKLGVSVPMKFPDDGKGNLGAVDIGFAFRPPSGVGLSLDVGVVKGGGYLYFDFDREEYAGVLELSVLEIVTVKAIGLITTKMPDGSKGFSLLLIITAEFGTGIQLGFGFTLLGVGGLLGLNRTMNLPPLIEGVRTGSINSIMFPQNPVENAPQIISDLRTIFPPYEGKFLIGPMAKLGWGTPTLISVSLGVIIEIPGNIAILGVLKVALPTEEAALILLQVNFAGAIEFDKKRLYFFASIFESRILFLTIEGEMGLLVAWGNDANFVVSVGGFHPRFDPPPLPFPNPKRIAVNILDTSIARIRVEGYFAVTSNTVQFGAKAELKIDVSVAQVEGHLAFDALFQFSPFFFIIEISASVSLKVFGIGLFSISLHLSLEGPTPWRAHGTGTLSLLFFDVSADFDITWGESKDTTLPPVAVMPLVRAELEKTDNWKAELPAGSNLLVSLRKLSEAETAQVLHPLGTLRLSQRAVPLDLKIDKVGSQKPSDANDFNLQATAGLEKSSDIDEQFAKAQFIKLSDSDKLSQRAFDPLHGGILLSAGAQQLGASKMAKRRVRYEQIIIDNNFKRFRRRFKRFSSRFFGHFLKGAAVAKSDLSKQYKSQLDPFIDEKKVSVQQTGFAVALTENNKAVDAQSIHFASETLAQQYMQQVIAKQPELHDSLHVIPQYETAQ
ncbi:MAG: hypothetical protein H6565_16810 [Lewinellaceae bacterium]|nr:hypothetical protein [Lewinellaceae bacterium]MCB9355784.1 hypothetical protein [Lewinellaceae bacterium]